ncbi:MAG: 30S ribosomal protein S8 [Bdellovibrionaceae bacterium]|nr:30S ribosomal protein S8 [Pseudobdellovibrionaceae bacterium]
MDTIGDFLTRIRNAGLAQHDKVDLPNSNMRQSLAKLLEANGYIRSYRVAKDGKQGIMRVYLKYSKDGNHVIKNIERVSRPSRRVYAKATDIPKVRSGYGVAIVSTSKGVMTGDQAAENNIGGEVICKIW